MARRTSYERDEFDAAADERTLEGAHRAEPRRRGGWLALIGVVILSPLLAWLVFTYGLRAGVLPDPAEALNRLQGQATEGVADQEAAHSTPPGAAGEGVDRELAVTVLDGTSSDGAAEAVTAALEETGYTQVSTAQYSSTQPTFATVFAHSEAEIATAQELADLITEAMSEFTGEGARQAVVVESSTAASSAPIVVVLRD